MSKINVHLPASKLLALVFALLIIGLQTSPAQQYRLPMFSQDPVKARPEDVNGKDMSFDWLIIYNTPTKQALLIDDTMFNPREDVPYRVYSGPRNISNWPGSISFAPGLGFIEVEVPILASGNIYISEGTYLVAEDRLGCGGVLSSKEQLEVGIYLNVLGDTTINGTLSSGWHIDCGGQLSCTSDLKCDGSVFAKSGIDVGGDLQCGDQLSTDTGDIRAQYSIEAGAIRSGNVEAGENVLVSDWIICDDLKAGGGITTGWDISASGTISCGKRILAGVDPSLDGSDSDQLMINCAKLLSGEVAYGILAEKGDQPEE